MLALLLNTCGERGIVGLMDEAGLRGEVTLPLKGTSEALMPAVREVLGGVAVAELAAVGVAVGPGSFTGVRVGLAAAKGLCEAGGVGLVGMSRLGLLAGAEGAAVLDAGRGEFYCGVYAGGAKVWERLLARRELDGFKEMVTCEARVAEALGERVRLAPEPGCAAMFAVLEQRVRAGLWSDVGSLDANYLRRTDAELKAGL